MQNAKLEREYFAFSRAFDLTFDEALSNYSISLAIALAQRVD
jgi:hypothetical protein